MQKSISAIIEAQRADSRNGDTDSIPDADFIRYNQYAQDRLVSLITLAHNWVFVKTKDINIVGGTDTYDINDNVAFGTRIIQVRYSFDGQEKNFRRLTPTPNRYDRLTTPGRPVYYRRVHGAVQIEPTPSVTEGVLRVEYERRLDTLDIKRCKISGTPSGTSIGVQDAFAGGVLSVELQTPWLSAAKTHDGYCSVSNFDGVPLLYAGRVASNTDSLLTLAANVSTYLISPYTLADLSGMYVTAGKYSTTHSKLPDEAESYLIEYVNRRVLARDSGSDEVVIDDILKEIEAAIVLSFKMPDKEVKSIPVSDWNMMIPGYE